MSASPDSQSIVLAAGCFWGVEEMIRQVPGVLDTEVGYVGGHTPKPTYEQICTGQTGHAEGIRVNFDPKRLPLDHLLDLFFNLHDPTQLNRQGNDMGTQYRSAIFVAHATDQEAAERAITRENASGRWPRPVATTIEPLREFHSAEAYHQDYLRKNPGGYNCHYWHHGDPTTRG